MKLRRIMILLALAAMAGACTSSLAASGGGGNSDRSGILIEVVTHGQASDPFWSIFKNGVDQAAKDTGAKVEYSAPQTFDMNAMGQLIDAAVGKKPAGLVVSIPDANALGSHISAAVSAGIPVISANSGSDAYAG